MNGNDYITYNNIESNHLCYKIGNFYFTDKDLSYIYYKVFYNNKDYYFGENDPRYERIKNNEEEVIYQVIDENISIASGQFFKIDAEQEDNNDNNFIEITQDIIKNNKYYRSTLNDNATVLVQENNNYREQEYYYYFDNNNNISYINSSNLANLTKYYLVQDYLSNYHYVPINEVKEYPELSYTPPLDEPDAPIYYIYKYDSQHDPEDPEHDPEQYIYFRQDFKQIQNILVKKESFISTNKYSLFAGEYYSKIVTNQASNNFITLSGNNNGITLINASNSPISINSNSNTFEAKIGNNYQFGFEMDKKLNSENNLLDSIKGEEILGKFTIDNYNKIGLFMTNN